MRISRLAQAVITAGLTSTAFAGGFALSEQSVSAMGTGNAGRASNAQDASVVYNNPAAMMQLKQAQFTGAMAFIDASTNIKNASGGIPGGTNDGDMVPFTYVPSGYFTSGDKGGWAWGVGAYGSFGLKTNYEPTFQGSVGGDKSKITVLTIQPVMSYRVNDKLSVAAGPTFNRLDALLSQSVAPALGAPTGEIKGKDWGIGYTLASYLNLSPSTKAGVVYRSKVKYKIDDGSFTVYAGGAVVGGPFSASTSATLPESVETSISHKLDQRNTLHAGVMWTRWSRLQTLDVTTGAGPLPSTQFHWKDSTAYSLGLTHQCNDKLQLRGGIAYDNTPVNPAFRSVRVPSGDRYIASLGAGYALSPTLSIDASYSYLQEKKATTAPDAAGYTADFHNHAHVFGLQFTQKL